MPDVLMFLQLGLSAVLSGVIIERVYYLAYVAPLSASGIQFVLQAIEQGELDRLRALVTQAPRSHVGRTVQLALDRSPDQEAASELSFELSARSIVGLRAIRVGATIASTTGLLVGIVRIRGGFGQPGLLALEAGLPEKVALGQALFSMAIGIGTSATCFYAVSLLREEARRVMAQVARVGVALAKLRP